MDDETPGHAAEIQASSETGQQVEMIFPMAGENIASATVVIDPPQFLVSSLMGDNSGIADSQSTPTAVVRCPAVESTTQVAGTTEEGRSEENSSKLKSASSMADSDNSDIDVLENMRTYSSSDGAEATSSTTPSLTADDESQEEVERDKDRCETHPDESVITYCQTCNRLVCLECLVEDDTHGSHKKITIKKLLATPGFFSETNEGLSKLLANKEQYLENLKQAAADIELGHESQIKAIRDMEQRALEELDRELEAETEKLKAAGEEQEEQIKEVARSAVEAVEKHMEVETSTIQTERLKVETTLPTLSDLTATMEKEPSLNILHDLVKGHQQSEHIFKTETGGFVVTGVETKAEKVDGKGMEQFTELTVKVVDVAANSTDGAQMDRIMKISSAVPFIQDLRGRTKALVPDCIITYNKTNRKLGSAVICKDYFTTCSNFGLHSSTLIPGCYKEPDFTNPVDVNDHIIFMDPTDATSLSSIFGGKPSLTMKICNVIWGLENDAGVTVSYYVWIVNKRGKRVTLESTEVGQRVGYAFLPASSTLYSALEIYLGWLPSEVKCQKTKQVFDKKMTVGEWGRTTECRRVVVIE